MRKFKFGLQRLLDYRLTVEDVLMAELAAIQVELEHETNRLIEITAARESFKLNMREMLVLGEPEEIKQANTYLHDLTQRMLLQKARVDDASARRELKTAEVVEASKDRKSLERLREYKVVEHRKETLRQEQKFLDEIAAVRHSRAA